MLYGSTAMTLHRSPRPEHDHRFADGAALANGMPSFDAVGRDNVRDHDANAGQGPERGHAARAVGSEGCPSAVAKRPVRGGHRYSFSLPAYVPQRATFVAARSHGSIADVTATKAARLEESLLTSAWGSADGA